jgi:hypothetical protein
MRRTHATLSLVLCSTMVLACGPAQGPSPAEAATQTPATAAVTPVLGDYGAAATRRPRQPGSHDDSCDRRHELRGGPGQELTGLHGQAEWR